MTAAAPGGAAGRYPWGVRVASTDDIDAMHRVRLMVRENRLSDPARVQADDYRLMLVDRGRGWVAEADGRVVGFAVADLVGVNLWALFVEPGFEGRGIGRALHDASIAWLFAEGARRIWLTTEPGSRAEGFYRAAGWRHAGSQRGEARYELPHDEWPGAPPRRPEHRANGRGGSEQ